MNWPFILNIYINVAERASGNSILPSNLQLHSLMSSFWCQHIFLKNNWHKTKHLSSPGSSLIVSFCSDTSYTQTGTSCGADKGEETFLKNHWLRLWKLKHTDPNTSLQEHQSLLTGWISVTSFRMGLQHTVGLTEVTNQLLFKHTNTYSWNSLLLVCLCGN